MGIDLGSIRESGLSPRRVARLLLTQPGGAEVWQEIGGWKALPDALVASMQIQYAIIATNSEKPPKPPKPPIGRLQERKKKQDLTSRFEKGAESHKAWLDAGAREEMQKRLAAWGPNWRKGTAGQKVNEEMARRRAQWDKPQSG